MVSPTVAMKVSPLLVGNCDPKRMTKKKKVNLTMREQQYFSRNNFNRITAFL